LKNYSNNSYNNAVLEEAAAAAEDAEMVADEEMDAATDATTLEMGNAPSVVTVTTTTAGPMDSILHQVTLVITALLRQMDTAVLQRLKTVAVAPTVMSFITS
jgi:hypothetical protein